MVKKKEVITDVITLGMKHEIIPFDFTILGEEAMPFVEVIHTFAYTELLSRPVLQMIDWSTRVQNMFMKNHLNLIKDVVMISEAHIQRLMGCGYKTRQEVFSIFKEYGIILEQWNPDKYWDKYSTKNYNKSKDVN